MKKLSVVADLNTTEIATTIEVVFPKPISRHKLSKIELAILTSKTLIDATQIEHKFMPIADAMKIETVTNTTPVIISAVFRVRTRGMITFLGRNTVEKIVRRYVKC